MNTSYSFQLRGRLSLEKYTHHTHHRLKIQAFNALGLLVGGCETSPSGFFHMPLTLRYPSDVYLTVKPAAEVFNGGSGEIYRHRLTTQDWISDHQRFSVFVQIEISRSLWHGWWPQQINVSGCIRNLPDQKESKDRYTIAVYEVDRSTCWWPFIQTWWEAHLNQQFTYAPQAVTATSAPLPFTQQANERPPPSRNDTHGFDTQEEIPLIPDALARRLENLTVLSDFAPWELFPENFFRTSLVAEATTDAHGSFNCKFDWHHVHERRGRRCDQVRPDLIVKASRVAKNNESHIYLDPYTSAQWNERCNHAQLDFYLNGTQTLRIPRRRQQHSRDTHSYISRIGNDPVSTINQATGLYSEGKLNNIAYGGNLRIHTRFRSDATDPSRPAYYRISFAKKGKRKFTPLSLPLTDIRIHNITHKAEHHCLGPHTIGNTNNLYEIRDVDNYLWHNPDFAGIWQTWKTHDGNGTYILRLEIYDNNGAKISTNNCNDYGNSTCRKFRTNAKKDNVLLITIDNSPPHQLEINAPRRTRYSETYLALEIEANHPNKRLHRWTLSTNINGQNITLADNATADEQVYSFFEHMTFDLTQLAQPACGLNHLLLPITLSVTPAIRNGYRVIQKRREQKTVAIDMRSNLPESTKRKNSGLYNIES